MSFEGPQNVNRESACPNLSSDNFYERLGLAKGARKEDITRAYQQLAKRYHENGSSPDPTAMRQIGEAYAYLKDNQIRAAYDRGGTREANDLSGKRLHAEEVARTRTSNSGTTTTEMVDSKPKAAGEARAPTVEADILSETHPMTPEEGRVLLSRIGHFVGYFRSTITDLKKKNVEIPENFARSPEAVRQVWNVSMSAAAMSPRQWREYLEDWEPIIFQDNPAAAWQTFMGPAERQTLARVITAQVVEACRNSRYFSLTQSKFGTYQDLLAEWAKEDRIPPDLFSEIRTATEVKELAFEDVSASRHKTWETPAIGFRRALDNWIGGGVIYLGDATDRARLETIILRRVRDQIEHRAPTEANRQDIVRQWKEGAGVDIDPVAIAA